MNASIIVVSGSNQGDYYPLGGRTVVVGRDEKCEIQILDELMSRKHLQLDFAETRQVYTVSDLKSANGVYVNDRKITSSTELADGDLIGLGDSRLMYVTRDFPDRKEAWDYYNLAGERSRSTLIQ